MSIQPKDGVRAPNAWCTKGAVPAVSRIFLQISVGIVVALAGTRWCLADAVVPIAPATEMNAEEAFRVGLERYDAHDYAGAIELFEVAYQKSKSPAALYNLAQSWRLLGKCSEAHARYKEFIAVAPDSPDRGHAEEWLSQLAPCALPSPDQWHHQSPDPPSVDDSDLFHRCTPVACTPSTRKIVAGGLMGAGVGFLAGAVLAAVRGHQASEALAALFRDGGTWGPAERALYDQGRTANVEAIVLASSALISAAAGVVLWRQGSSE
jgi:tetratricopeptide (TPR) repeat protein